MANSHLKLVYASDRGFQELQDFRTDSPSCPRESVRIAFVIIASNFWTLDFIDVKTAFLQGKRIVRPFT